MTRDIQRDDFKKWLGHIIAAAIFSGLVSCQSSPSASHSATPATAGAKDTMKTDAKPTLKSLHLSFANPKDPSCGMPLTAGLEDTVRYKGKLYGFCSKECKDAFLKDPEAGLATLK